MAEELCCKVRYEWDYVTGISAWLLLYQGEAEPGAGTNEAKWRIRKYTYNAQGNPVQIDWADGTHAFTKIWDSRDGYSYS